MSHEIISAISRIRRMMPRNAEAMLICDELERRLVTVTKDGTAKPKFDRVAYQRDLMRKRRAEARRKAEQK